VVKQLRKLRAKLNHAAIEDFKKIGLIAQRAPISYILAECDGTQYTLKAVSKAAAFSFNMQERVKEEVQIESQLFGRSRFVPMAVTHFESKVSMSMSMSLSMSMSMSMCSLTLCSGGRHPL